MRLKVPPKIYWTTYALICLSFVSLMAFYLTMLATHQEPPKDVAVWLERLFSVFLGIVYTPHETNGHSYGTGKDAPADTPDTAPASNTEGNP